MWISESRFPLLVSVSNLVFALRLTKVLLGGYHNWIILLVWLLERNHIYGHVIVPLNLWQLNHRWSTIFRSFSMLQKELQEPNKYAEFAFKNKSLRLIDTWKQRFSNNALPNLNLHFHGNYTLRTVQKHKPLEDA